MKRAWIVCFLFMMLASYAGAQSLPGVAQTAPNAWIGPGIIGRDVHTGGDAPDLIMASQAGATESILQYSGTNGTASTLYVQLFKSNTVPANGSTPELEDAVAAGTSFCRYLYPMQSLAATGFVIACSTTQGSLTLTSTNDCFLAAKVSP
jgi:hypothetical protein